MTYFLPDLITASLLLKAKRQIKVIALRPNNKRVLLLLVCGVRLDFTLQQQRSVGFSTHQQRDTCRMVLI